MKNRVELYFCENPLSKMYHNLAFPLGIIQANAKSDITPWLCSKYTNCFFIHKDTPETMFDICVDDKWALNDRILIEERVVFLKEFYEKMSIDYIELLKKFISLGSYPHGDYNEEFIPGKIYYGKRYFEHDYILYGYDDDREVFLSAGYLKNQKFQKHEISYQNMSEALYSLRDERLSFWFLRYNENAEFTFDIKKVKKGISSYINCENDAVGIKYEYVGLEAIEKLGLYMLNCTENNLMIDLRYTRGVMEHKNFMQMRIKYLLDNGYIDNNTFLTESQEVYKYAENIHMLGIKYNFSQKRSIGKSIYDTILIMLAKEYKYLNDLEKDLIC